MPKEWKDMTEQELIDEANIGSRGQGANIEMLRRNAAKQKIVTGLTWAIMICTALLLGLGLRTCWLETHQQPVLSAPPIPASPPGKPEKGSK